MMKHYSEYFYGNKISDYGLKNNRVDYGTLAKAFDAVLNNEIMQKTCEIGYWEQESGFVDNSEEIEELKEQIEVFESRIRDFDYASEEELEELNLIEDEEVEKLESEISKLEERIEELEEEQEDYDEIYQYYIVSDNGARILKEINEIIFYNEELDMYVWGVTHFGTSWDYVLTDIEIDK